MTQLSTESKWSPLTPLEPRCPGLVSSAVSLVTWNMRCSQECPVLLLLHFVFSLAACHEELSDSGRLFSLFAEQGQCGAVACMNAWLENFLVSTHPRLTLICCIQLFCRSVVPARFGHCPPSENQRWWRVPLPLSVSPLQERESQTWPATTWFWGTGLLQVRLQGSSFNVQPDCKQSPAFKWLHPGEEEWPC